MFGARSRRKLVAASLGALFATAAGAFAGARETRPPQLVDTSRSKYRLVQGDREVGHEAVTRRVFDNNTVIFEVETTLESAPGTRLEQRTELTVEEESYFPRSFRATKTVRQGNSDFEQRVSVDVYANVAVIETAIGGRSGTRRVVIPAGTPVMEVGVLYCWYQVLFWHDREQGGHQRFQTLNPATAKVEGGEMYVVGEETIPVLGKPTPTTVFKMERESLGEAKLHVDGGGHIVRGEQNLMTFELVERSEGKEP